MTSRGYVAGSGRKRETRPRDCPYGGRVRTEGSKCISLASGTCQIRTFIGVSLCTVSLECS